MMMNFFSRDEYELIKLVPIHYHSYMQ